MIRVEAKPSEVDQEGYPSSMVAVVELPARGELPPVKLTVYAKESPPRDCSWVTRAALGAICWWDRKEQSTPITPGHAVCLVAEGEISKSQSRPAETLPVWNGHHRKWVEACKGNGKTFSGFEMGGPLTELIQLVNLATLVEGPVEYDALSGKIVNSKSASALLQSGVPQRLGALSWASHSPHQPGSHETLLTAADPAPGGAHGSLHLRRARESNLGPGPGPLGPRPTPSCRSPLLHAVHRSECARILLLG